MTSWNLAAWDDDKCGELRDTLARSYQRARDIQPALDDAGVMIGIAPAEKIGTYWHEILTELHRDDREGLARLLDVLTKGKPTLRSNISNILGDSTDVPTSTGSGEADIRSDNTAQASHSGDTPGQIPDAREHGVGEGSQTGSVRLCVRTSGAVDLVPVVGLAGIDLVAAEQADDMTQAACSVDGRLLATSDGSIVRFADAVRSSGSVMMWPFPVAGDLPSAGRLVAVGSAGRHGALFVWTSAEGTWLCHVTRPTVQLSIIRRLSEQQSRFAVLRGTRVLLASLNPRDGRTVCDAFPGLDVSGLAGGCTGGRLLALAVGMGPNGRQMCVEVDGDSSTRIWESVDDSLECRIVIPFAKSAVPTFEGLQWERVPPRTRRPLLGQAYSAWTS